MKKILVINGSPLKNGNTAKILNQMMKGISESLNSDVCFHEYNLEEINFEGCNECMDCRETFACSLDDDMSEILEELKEADYLIFGTPIFMWQITGQAKCFIDRLYPVISNDFKTRLSDIATITVYTQANPDKNAFINYISHNNEVLDFLGLNVIDTLIVGGLNEQNPAEKHVYALEKAYHLGKKLIK
ncbi:flavodoxin family protein [Methanococcus voltae]|uniref:NAD(P)H dehydrogenase (Quinone) n=1 Tax=Methanococcus voltae (strain ATCC BAA-1334 / A3) TaxID=456320 RepID=D7DU12_METV3|nr:flavodoxin family protein [Methanococcus voltae]MCS3900422.1 multimeric flavodoxin WrbA [Methanococcus voltae]